MMKVCQYGNSVYCNSMSELMDHRRDYVSGQNSGTGDATAVTRKGNPVLGTKPLPQENARGYFLKVTRELGGFSKNSQQLPLPEPQLKDAQVPDLQTFDGSERTPNAVVGSLPQKHDIFIFEVSPDGMVIKNRAFEFAMAAIGMIGLAYPSQSIDNRMLAMLIDVGASFSLGFASMSIGTRLNYYFNGRGSQSLPNKARE